MPFTHKEILDQMTLKEKAYMMSGKDTWSTVDIPRLGVPSMVMSDGPHGLRRQAGAGDHLGINASLPATCFPTAATVANSWDEALGERIGRALAEEAVTMGVHVVLGPGLNIKRSPLCGRNFEYFSEDPYQAGKIAAAYIRGIQEKGIAACPKHFAANSQELRRMANDSVMDERTLREIYTTNFEIAVKEGKALSIMSAYNEVNGIYANESTHLLQDILKDEWEFKGIVISDWGGSNDHALGVETGSHLEMPSTGKAGMRDLVTAVENGILEEEVLTKRVDELLNIIDATKDAVTAAKGTKFDEVEHDALARDAALESIVLLKNEEKLLPLKKGTRVAIIGDFASKPRYQGAGSSLVNVIKTPENLFDEMMKTEMEIIGYAQGYVRNRKPVPALVEQAKALAAKADVVIVACGLDEISESEGLDRKHMRMPEAQDLLIQELTDLGKKIVVVLSAGSAVEMPWCQDVQAIVHGYLGGQSGASAMAMVLTGAYNPCGKLSESYPFHLEDTPCANYYPAKERDSQFREAVYVGYRYYLTAGVPVRFPFGFGLSYTSYQYGDFQVAEEGVSLSVTNTGEYDGAEIVQLYVGKESDTIFRPVRELKGFARVELKAGETKTVHIDFDDKTFRFYDVRTDTWEVETGNYCISVGASSEDIRLTDTLKVEGTVLEGPYSKEQFPEYFSGKVTDISQEKFAALYGEDLPDGSWSGEIRLNDAVCQLYYGKGILGKMLYGILTLLLKYSEWKGTPNLNLLFNYNMPIRGYAKMTGGAVTMDMCKALTEMANGHRIIGTGHFIKACFHR